MEKDPLSLYRTIKQLISVNFAVTITQDGIHEPYLQITDPHYYDTVVQGFITQKLADRLLDEYQECRHEITETLTLIEI